MQYITDFCNFNKIHDDTIMYVDKTKEIFQLLQKERICFARPKGFGKSLTLSAIGSLFEEGVEPHFKGTWIYDNWHDVTYPVLRLDFKDFSSALLSEFVDDFCNAIEKFAREKELRLKPCGEDAADVLRALLQALPPHQRIVLLIDNYDAGLMRHMNNPNVYANHARFLLSLYHVLKGDERIRFIGMAGITRIIPPAISAADTDIEDVTYDRNLAALTGYTREEIQRNFREFIHDAVQQLYHIKINPTDFSYDEPHVRDFMDCLEREYGGYCFDEDGRQTVFCPCSINTFIRRNTGSKRIRFGMYWCCADEPPAAVQRFVDLCNQEFSMEFLQQRDALHSLYTEFKFPGSHIKMTLPVMMCQMGWLTLSSELKAPYSLTLGIPNNEIRCALARLFYRKWTGQWVDFDAHLRAVLEKGSVEEIVGVFNQITQNFQR